MKNIENCLAEIISKRSGRHMDEVISLKEESLLGPKFRMPARELFHVFFSDDLLNGLACIYKPDIFFVAADKENISANIGDAWIEEGSLIAGGFRKRYGSGKELKTQLVEMFTDIAE